VLLQHHGDLTVDTTERLHPEVAAMCVLAVQAVGLDIAGLDLVAGDIGVPLAEQGGALIEVNASPGLLAHIKPLIGKPRPVGQAIVNQLFAPGNQGRIPIVAVSGTRGRNEVTQIIAGCLSATGQAVARADSTGLYLGERLLRAGSAADATGGRHALMNPGAGTAVLETSELSVLETGLCFDHCQIAVVTTTLGAEQVARPGVEDRSHVDKAIRAPVDVVVPDGFAILNAADPTVVEMAEKCPGKIVWFAESLAQGPIGQHLQAGGAALVRLGSQLIWYSGGENRQPVSVRWLTESTAPSRVEPLMAAAAAVLALGVSRAALEDFINKYGY
jgi:cyanophycin synthetase